VSCSSIAFEYLINWSKEDEPKWFNAVLYSESSDLKNHINSFFPKIRISLILIRLPIKQHWNYTLQTAVRLCEKVIKSLVRSLSDKMFNIVII